MLLGQVDIQSNVFAGSLHLDDADYFRDGLLDLHVDSLGLESAALNLRVVKSVVDVVQHEDA